MMFPGKRRLLSTVMLSTLLTACGGGGGGGGNPSNDDRGTQPIPLTALPAFLQSATAHCTAVESGNTVSLVEYRGTLANITAINCDGATLANLNEIEQLSALKILNVPNAGLTSVDELLALAAQLKTLNVGENALTDLITIAQLTALENLDLSGLGLTDISALVNLGNLKTLDLSNNNITELDALTALTQLQQVQLSGNGNLDCSDVKNFSSTLSGINNSSSVIPPAKCTTALFLDDKSAATQIIDISTSTPKYGSVYIGADYTFDDLVFRKSGNNLTLVLLAGTGERSITLQDWFVDTEHRINLFVISGAGEYSFFQFRNEVEMVETLTDGNDEYIGTDGDDVVYGGDGDDFLSGGQGYDTLYGGRGNDILFGGYHGDTFIGGPGDDLIATDRVQRDADGNITSVDYDLFNHTILFNLGDGNDVIASNGSSSPTGLLKFGVGITADMIMLSRTANSLRIQIGESDSVTIFNWFVNSIYYNYKLKDIEFDSQEPIAFSDFILNRILTVTGTQDNDTISGSAANDIINGLAGDDVIYGDSGDDSIEGGAGNDILSGDTGKDIIQGGPGDDWIFGYHGTLNQAGIPNVSADDYDQDIIIFNQGDGNDTIVQYLATGSNIDILRFGEGITPDKVKLIKSGESLILRVSENDSVTLYRYFSPYFGFGYIQFGEATPQLVNDFLVNKVVTIRGTSEYDNITGTIGNDIVDALAGNDYIYGYDGADQLFGGEGNDTILGGDGSDILHGGPGNDTLTGSYLSMDGAYIKYTSSDGSADLYLFNVGDGNDTIVDEELDNNNHGTLRFGPGISANDLTLSKNGSDLVINISENDSVTIYRWYFGYHQLAYIQFNGQAPIDAVAFVNARLAP